MTVYQEIQKLLTKFNIHLQMKPQIVKQVRDFFVITQNDIYITITHVHKKL